jgi:hypothetical protein
MSTTLTLVVDYDRPLRLGEVAQALAAQIALPVVSYQCCWEGSELSDGVHVLSETHRLLCWSSPRFLTLYANCNRLLASPRK